MSILKIEELSKTYRTGFWGRRTVALQGIDLEIEENEIFGYLGPNGAGKTTTLKAILSLIRPTGGVIKMFNRPFSEIDLKKRIGYMPENPYFYTYLTALETLNFYARLFDLPAAQRRQRSHELLEQVGLGEVKDVVLRHFSKGMLQRIAIAQALINNPTLVFLDEPMSGLDPIGRKEVRDIILNLKNEGKTIFFSSHILSDVEMICDRVAIVLKGKIIRMGNLEEMRASQIKSVEVTAISLSTQVLETLNSLGCRLIQSGDQTLILIKSADDQEAVIKAINADDGQIVSIVPRKTSLEELFMSHVNEVQNEKN